MLQSAYRITLLFITLGLFACATETSAPVTQELVREALPETTDIALQWQSAIDRGAVSGGWLATFNDRRLEGLAEEALNNNRALVAAAANLDVAAGLAKQAGARLAPAVSIGGAGEGTKRGGTSTDGAGVGLNVQWEMDVWGRLRAGASAAEESFRASEADFEFARQSLVAQTAKAWFLATEAFQQRQLANDAVDIYSKILDIVTSQTEVGQAQPQDLYLAKADLGEARERQRQAQGAFEQSIRSLEVLLGRYPSAELKAAEEFVAMPAMVPAGVPSALLERRPDIQAAERQVAAAFQRIKEAKAAKLPRITLTGSSGRSSNDLIDLIGANKGFFSLGANFLAPLDLGGELQAQVEIESAQQEAAIANYGQAALQAFNEVESALTNEALLGERESLLFYSVENNRGALDVSQTKYEFGQIDLLSVLQLQARLLNSRVALIRIRNARLAQRVDLHLALGGSFK